MVTLTERTIMKSRSGVYSDTAENRRKHRVGQKYGAEKQSDDGEKTEKKETDPAKELEAVNKVIAAINEGKLKLPQEEIMVLIEKKNNLELAKRQAEKIHSGVKANEEKRNAAEVKETSKKINEAQKEESRGEKKTDKAADPIYQVQQKKKEASKKYDSKREEARQKYDKEADEIQSERDKLYESDHPDAVKKRKELWNTLKEKTNKYNAEITRLKDEYEAEYKKLDEAEDKLYDQRQKEETSEEVKESYTRVKFDDIPNSGKVNLKKYLSEKVRKGVDEKWSNIKNIPTDNLKKMEKGLVNDLNKNFEAIKKSQRAELLYSIMKIKGELEKRGKESQKKE